MADFFTVTKDPQAVLDYRVDWSAWLSTDTIASVVWTVPSGITQASATNTTTSATIWLSSGEAGTDYLVGCRITTAGGRTDERSILVSVRQR